MTDPHLAQVQGPRRLNRTHLWRLLLCSVIWGAVSFGCATVNYVTNVIYTGSGYGAVVSLEVEYDPGVYAALLEIDPKMTSGIAATQGEAGWDVTESMNGRKLRIRRSFDTLAGLATVPKLLAGESGDVSDSFIQSVAVTENAIDDETVEYVYTATVVIEATEQATGGAEGEEGIFDDYPNLQAALEKAGPAKILVQTYLPGTIYAYSRNGVVEGEVNGGRVSWSFREDQPGTYQLSAVSRGPSAAAAQSDLEEIHRSNQHIQEFEELVNRDPLGREFAFQAAQAIIIDVREAVGQDRSSKVLTRKELALLEVGYFSQFCTDWATKPKCDMPNVVRAMPQIKKLAIKIGDDEEAVAALEGLVKQLVEQDLQKLREKANKP